VIIELPGDDDPRRRQVRDWLDANPNASGRTLAEAGYVAPHWPAPWGLGADPITQLIIDQEFRAAGVQRPSNTIGIGWAGPTIIEAGTQEQKDRYLVPLLAGEETWCQLFSEPGAGSDLAGLGTRAVRSGDEYVINGSKIWTSGAHNSQFGILLARTDPDAPKHQGISYFICPMDTPGIEMQQIKDMAGTTSFNQVFFDDVRIPASNLVGEPNDGWRLAKVTLGNERVSLSGGGTLWGGGPSMEDLVDAVKANGGVHDPLLRDRLGALYAEHLALKIIRLQTLSARVAGRQPGTEASVQKGIADVHGQKAQELARDLAGAAGLLATAGPPGAEDAWSFGFLFSRALTIGGGTTEVQLNILAERVLGLPRDVDIEAGQTWAEARTGPRRES